MAIYERINSVSTKAKHGGRNAIRKLLSSFDVQGLQGKHTCIVHEALGITMDYLLDYLPNRSLKLEEVKPFLRQLLIGLDFLYTQTGIVYTGKSCQLSDWGDGVLPSFWNRESASVGLKEDIAVWRRLYLLTVFIPEYWTHPTLAHIFRRRRSQYSRHLRNKIFIVRLVSFGILAMEESPRSNEIPGLRKN